MNPRSLQRGPGAARTSGFTLIEVMVALVLGLLLTAAVIQIFLHTKQTFRVQQSLAHVEETGRYALDRLGRELRGAGFVGCAGNDELLSTLNAAAANDVDLSRPAAGHDAESGSWEPALPSAVGDDEDPVAGSDALTLQVTARRQRATVTDHPAGGGNGAGPGSAALRVAPEDALEACQVAIAMKCPHAAAFTITGINGNQLVHNTGNSCSNGYSNATKNLGADMTGGEVVGLATETYFVRNNDAGVPGLWARSSHNGVARELVSGVERLHITYGLDGDADGRIDEYASAADVDDANAWPDLLGVRIQLLARAPETGVTDGDHEIIFGDDDATFGGDGRLRRVFGTTVAMRNRLR